jgi:hypothetical protein
VSQSAVPKEVFPQGPSHLGRLFAMVITLGGCGGGTAVPSATPPVPMATPAVATWGTAEKLAEAGPALNLLYGGPNPPRVRLESLPDGTAFALWDRNDPLTIAAARFSAGRWETPVQGSGAGRVHSWLAAGATGRATIIWGETVPGVSGDRSRFAWVRRYLPGSGWLPQEKVQSVVSTFSICCTIGANIPDPELNSAAVMADSGEAQAIWNRGYPTQFPYSPSDVYSARLGLAGEWSGEELLAAGERVSLLRVSRSRAVAFWSEDFVTRRIQVFDAAQGWQAPWPGPRTFGLITSAKEGFAITQSAAEGQIVRGLGLNGDLGPQEVLFPSSDPSYGGTGSSDLCGNESGALAYVRTVSDQINFKYRGASDSPPGFTTVALRAPGRSAADPVVCHVDAGGRATIIWLASQTTFADRYVPGRGFEGTSSIGPGFATTPAIGSDSQGNVLGAWAVLTVDKRVEIWWNRLREP